MGSTPPASHQLHDCYGRAYRVGPSAELLTGHPRGAQLAFAAVAMAAAGVLQYGFGALVPSLSDLHGWSGTATLWLLAVWTAAQALVGLPVARLRERGTAGPVPLVVLGGFCCLLAPAALGRTPGYLGALLGFSVLGGTGAGLVYAVATSTAAKWFPDRSAVRVSLATGAFAWGAVPFTALAVPMATPDTVRVLLDSTAVLSACLVIAAGLLLRDPPPRWWPPHVDPRVWALRRSRGALPAVRDHSPGQAVRAGAPLLAAVLCCASAVTLFTVATFVPFARDLGLGVPVLTTAAVLLVAANGAARAVVLRVSERIGRTRTLGAALTVLALSQLCLAVGGGSANAAPLLAGAVLAGAGGACYPLVASVVRDYFGDTRHAEIHALVYSAKAVGGLVGIGVGATLAPTWGYPVLFLVTSLLALVSAGLSRGLRQPGRMVPPWTTQRVR
ncbi:MFS family permease [Crossiella equi]|uniref:MFS family permease n=1 Tax=Crossiella equi TaxID=130796 RepID=A0ABS5AQC4_9PSEU|nr:MFS transporter [Crossiella equi]MBP2478766.1 MFS family permease [Crossiella equi]